MPSCQWRGDRVLGSCVPLHICSYPGRSSLSSILWSSYHGRSTLSLSYHHQHYQHHHHTRGHNLKYEALGDLPFAEISWSSILNDIIMIWCHLIGDIFMILYIDIIMSLDRRPWAKPSRASSPSSCLSRWTIILSLVFMSFKAKSCF